MSSQIIHSAPLNEYKALFWRGIPVYKRAEAIKSVLHDTAVDIRFMLADPLITSEAEKNLEPAYWLFKGSVTVRNYSVLSAAEQQSVLVQLQHAGPGIPMEVQRVRGSGSEYR